MMNLRIFLAISLLSAPLSAHAAKGGIGAMFGALIGGGVANAAGKATTARMTADEALVKVTTLINPRLPITIDPDTRWDSTVAGPGRRFTYHYTITTVRASDINAINFNQNMTPHLRNNACKNMPEFFQNGVAVAYSYRGNDGGHVTTIEINPRDCPYR